MRRSIVASLIALSVSALAFACGAPAEEEAASGEDAVGSRNLAASAFGLVDKELALTLDDGPGPRTIELAEWLAREKVPATFFMVGKNAKANPAAVQRIVDLSNANNGLFIVANHSMNHQARPLPSLGTDVIIDEIMDADAILKSAIAASQSKLPSAVSFFRPPYGDLVRIGPANIATINAAGADKYQGPVFWDIGGELKNGFSADWACWGKISPNACADGYIREAQTRKRGLILTHDVHSRTVDMLTGANGNRSLIKDLRAQGFKFVSLRAHDATAQRSVQEEERLSSSTSATITADVSVLGRSVAVDIRAAGGTKLAVSFDGQAATISPNLNRVALADLGPGQHFVTVTVLDANGRAQREERYPFIVPADIDDGSPETFGDTNTPCVNFNLMKAGQLFRLYHSKVACNTAGANKPPFVDDCYKYKGTLTASRNPQLVGPGEWSLEFNLAYKTDPNDKSKVNVVMAASSGEIEGGTRSFPNTARTSVPITMNGMRCEKGEWRGQFHYANGSTEDLLFRMDRDPLTGQPIDHE
ncbi:polysaccharide deacetylase [Labilithrix luteola]|uniref:Polysaccharide deacetylase n=1 Tax=Labilithrix luteola TaxID=1391654 RepID=A0A0K1PZL3_9BACT|nr:polysaccharide deacetylase family protein [Labilithrix luteola]AKU98975.1 polysaccharide deacetylase [Labilithrix luteola]